MFTRRLKSHHELYPIFKDMALGRGDVHRYLQSLSVSPCAAVIYIHIPFCRKICSFCNMIRSLGPTGETGEDYARLLSKEIGRYREIDYIRGLTFEAVYFGGGTPTALSSRALQEILTAVRQNFHLAQDAEITLESTVSELTEEKMDCLQAEGVNRISLGVQTFNDRGRQLLGRTGNGKDAYQKIRRMKSRGIRNLNIDLIYHYPRQTGEEVEEDLKKTFSLELAGFSFYSLITPPESPLQNGAREENGTERDLFDRIYTRAAAEGFSLLELTKLTRYDSYRYMMSRHDGADTLALGAGAGGNLADMTYMNPVSLCDYQNYVESGGPRAGIITKQSYQTVSRLTGDLQQGRIPRGEERYKEMFGERINSLIEQLLQEGYIVEQGADCRLTPRGIYWGQNICDAFLRNLRIEPIKSMKKPEERTCG